MPTTVTPAKSAKRGQALLLDPLLNRGTAFTEVQRAEFGLLGLLPPDVETIDEQAARAYEAFLACPSDLGKHIYLRALQDTNEVLFYYLLARHVEEMMPIVYTPTVAVACEQFSRIYHRPRGLIIPFPLRERIPEILANRPNRDVDVIVVTDGGRILGIGDQGVGGLGISIGKLSLYTLIGGIHPARTLPIILDVGTSNPARLADPQYMGWRHERVVGDEYFDFINRFVRAVRDELPHACVQWEDFPNSSASTILRRYREELLSFNDDIQGTAAVALGAILGAVAATGRRLRDQTLVVFGAGSAGIGVADYLRSAMVDDGLSDGEARGRIWLVNRGGLLHTGRTDLSDEQRAFAHTPERFASFSRDAGGRVGLPEVIKSVEATILIGLSTLAGAFTESIVRAMARKTARPIIFPLSNPTSRAEATPEDLMQWTEGRALVATGSPFKPVHVGGRAVAIAQCNNVYIFPAVGLALAASGATRVTDGMMLSAARALAEQSPALGDPAASLLPPVRDLRATAGHVALAVALQARKDGVAPEVSADELRRRIAASQWTPAYD